MTYPSIDDPRFDQVVTLRDAYRVMEQFAQSYLAMGDAPVSSFLWNYASELVDGRTADPSAITDFLRSADEVLERRQSSDATWLSAR
jgi:hypothetical protein